jgi:hypothetical protein
MGKKKCCVQLIPGPQGARGPPGPAGPANAQSLAAVTDGIGEYYYVLNPTSGPTPVYCIFGRVSITVGTQATPVATPNAAVLSTVLSGLTQILSEQTSIVIDGTMTSPDFVTQHQSNCSIVGGVLNISTYYTSSADAFGDPYGGSVDFVVYAS